MKPRLVIFSHACVVPANRELFLELTKRYQLLLVVPRNWKGSLIQELRASSDSQVITYPVVNSGNGSLFFYRSLFQEVRRFGPDLILLDEEPWSLVALQVYLRFPGARKVFYTKQNLFKSLPPPFGWLQRWVFRRSAGAFVISKEAEDVLRWKGFRGEVEELPHSLNSLRFRPPAAEERKEIRAQFQLGAEDFLVGYFGRLTPEKGMEDVVKAAAEISRSGARARIKVVLVGNGPLFPNLQKNARENPVLVVLPALPHDKVHKLMSAMDVTLLPSRTTARWKEQFGRVIIESAAAAVPVIGSSSGEIPKLIERVGCGLSFPEGDAPALARAIERLANDHALRAKLGIEGASVAHAQFSHEAVGGFLARRLEGFRAHASMQ